VLPVQSVKLRLSRLAPEHDSLVDETLGRFADPRLGAAADHPMQPPAGELLFRARKRGKHIAVEGWRDNAEWT